MSNHQQNCLLFVKRTISYLLNKLKLVFEENCQSIQYTSTFLPQTFLIYNRCTLHTALKVGKVVPTDTKEDVLKLENYRPVAISSSLSKIFESSYLYHFESFTKRHIIFFDNRHGFRPRTSTTTDILPSFDKIIEYMLKVECSVQFKYSF